MKVNLQERRHVFVDVFDIEEAVLQYELYDGSMSEPVRRLSLERGDSAAAILFDRARGSVILVEQFRYPAWSKGGGWLIETIAGVVDPGESPELAVLREIEEESGYRVDAVTHVSTFFLSPGGSSERVFLYCALVDSSQRVDSGGGLDSENEDIRVLEIPTAELRHRLARGDFADAKTLIGLQWLLTQIDEDAE